MSENPPSPPQTPAERREIRDGYRKCRQHMDGLPNAFTIRQPLSFVAFLCLFLDCRDEMQNPGNNAIKEAMETCQKLHDRGIKNEFC